MIQMVMVVKRTMLRVRLVDDMVDNPMNQFGRQVADLCHLALTEISLSLEFLYLLLIVYWFFCGGSKLGGTALER